MAARRDPKTGKWRVYRGMVSLNRTLYEDFRRFCRTHGRPMSLVLGDLIQAALARKEPPSALRLATLS